MRPTLHSFAYAIDYLREQVADLSNEQMVQQPAGVLNHPAWVIGHLTFVCQMIGGVIGVEPWLPEDFARRFGTGSAPVSDASAYESKAAALERLGNAQQRIAAAVARLSDEQLDRPFPDPACHEVFPTVRHALTQVLVGHAAFHVGQVSIWRRAAGLRPIERGFE